MKKKLNPNRFIYTFFFYVFLNITFFSTDAFAITEQEIQKDIRTYWTLKSIQKKRERLLPNISNIHTDKTWKDAHNKIQSLLIEKYLPYLRGNRNKNIYHRFYTATEKKYNEERRDEMVAKFHADLKRQSIARKKISQNNKTNSTKTQNTDNNQISIVEEYAEWIGWVGGTIVLLIAISKFQRKNNLSGIYVIVSKTLSLIFYGCIAYVYFWVAKMIFYTMPCNILNCDSWN